MNRRPLKKGIPFGSHHHESDLQTNFQLIWINIVTFKYLKATHMFKLQITTRSFYDTQNRDWLFRASVLANSTLDSDNQLKSLYLVNCIICQIYSGILFAKKDWNPPEEVF